MILVTGGTGLVGAHLLLHLAENLDNGPTQIRAIYRNSNSIEKTKNLFQLYNKPDLFNAVEWMQADIIDIPSLEKAFTGVEYVYHCAALISFDSRDEDRLRKINIEGTANIVNFSIANKIQKLCFVSSIAALGDLAPHELLVTEETEWNPENPHSDYAISKYGAEMEVWRGQQEGLQVLIVNPGVILGPGFWQQGSGKLFTKIKEGLKFYTLGTTGFVAVPDVVKIATVLMKSNIVNERYILIAENLVFREVLNSMADAVSVRRPNFHAGPLLMGILWRIDWFVALLFQSERKLTKDAARASHANKQFSNLKIKSELNWNFIDVRQYIRDIAKMQ